MSTENTDTNSNHPQSRWFICSPKFRFSDQRKTPQWRTGPCPKNKKKDIRFWISFFLLLRARDGTRTRQTLTPKNCVIALFPLFMRILNSRKFYLNIIFDTILQYLRQKYNTKYNTKYLKFKCINIQLKELTK